METWADSEKVPEEIWSDMKAVFTETSEEKLGRKRHKKPKPYISDEVKELAKQKSDARKMKNTDQYKKLKREIKSKIRRDRRIWLEQECEKINEHNENRKSRELFEQVRSLKQTKFKAQNQCINKSDGTTLTEPQKILGRWHEYGNTLFNTKNNIKSMTDLSFENSNFEREPPPLISEVEAAISELKCRKSPGLDNIPGELLKHSGEGGVRAMHHLCCEIWKTGHWPQDWKTQEFVMLHKGGNVKDCNNYRTIALISHSSKILLIIILKRMKYKVELELSDCQAGYRINRGTIDMLFVLQNIIEKIQATNEELFITFIDYSKAFDSVIHEHLYETMHKLGFPRHIIALLSSLYKNQKGTIRWDNQNCEFFDITKGVRQGCILSPHLFNIYTEQIMREADIDDMGLKIGGRNITNLRYADDTALIADNVTSMRRILYRVDAMGKEAGLKLNAKKTKVIHVTGKDSSNNKENNKIEINKEALETVEDFKYLGSIKTKDGKCMKDVKARTGMAKNKMLQLNTIWKDHSIPITLKIKLLQCLIWPVLMYGCESWTIRKSEEDKIQATEMWFYRRLLGVSWKEKRTNESILEQLGVTRILMTKIMQRKLKYTGHALRNTNTDLMKSVLVGKIEPTRKQGRPPISLIDNITKSSGMKLHEVSWASQRRTEWRRKVMSVSYGAAATVDTDDADR